MTEVNFEQLMQADFVLFLRADLHPSGDEWRTKRWWPETMVFADEFRGAFEIFSRAQSKRYFGKLKIALNIKSKAEIENLLEKYKQGKLMIPTFGGFSSFNPATLINIDKLDSQP